MGEMMMSNTMFFRTPPVTQYRSLVCSLASAVFLFRGAQAQNAPLTPSGSFVVTHVRLFDGEHTSTDQTVLVQEGKIAAVGKNVSVPSGTSEIDGAGRTLLPGLIDAHVHAYPENALREAEALGVTTVLDMFNDPDTVRRDKTAEGSGAGLAGADIYSSGILATVPHGHGTEYGFAIPTLTTPAEAQDFVDARIAEGSDYIKIILEDGSAFGHPIPTLDRPTLDALVIAAHKRHKMAVCHVGTYQEAREAIEAGADGLMHLFIDRVPDPDFGTLAASHHVFVVPTLSVLLSATGTNEEGKSLADDKRLTKYLAHADIGNLRRTFGGGRTTHFEATTESIRQLKAAHAEILAGTDAPNPGTMFGASLHGELELLVVAGLSPEEALRAATSKPADCFSLSDRGRIVVGKRADLLLVTGDPTQNITDTRNIVAVWKSGHADDRAAWAGEMAEEQKANADAPRAPVVTDRTISTFEDGTTKTGFGAGWAKSTDALFGGKSTTDYEVIADGANGTKKSLQITGEIVGGVPYPWAGALFSPGGQPFAPANLSKSSGIQFWARGDGKTYRIMVFTGTSGNIPQVMTFAAGPEWKHYSFPFSTFGGSDGHDTEAILFSGGPDPGKFSFQIDEVGLVAE
jgi:imidazolonepropionase-like amidohydrolase